MMVSQEYRDELLREASNALETVCKMISLPIEKRDLHAEEMVPTVATKLYQEIHGFRTWNEALMEATRRNKIGSSGYWTVFWNPIAERPIVRLFGNEQ